MPLLSGHFLHFFYWKKVVTQGRSHAQTQLTIRLLNHHKETETLDVRQNHLCSHFFPLYICLITALLYRYTHKSTLKHENNSHSPANIQLPICIVKKITTRKKQLPHRDKNMNAQQLSILSMSGCVYAVLSTQNTTPPLMMSQLEPTGFVSSHEPTFEVPTNFFQSEQTSQVKFGFRTLTVRVVPAQKPKFMTLVLFLITIFHFKPTSLSSRQKRKYKQKKKKSSSKWPLTLTCRILFSHSLPVKHVSMALPWNNNQGTTVKTLMIETETDILYTWTVHVMAEIQQMHLGGPHSETAPDQTGFHLSRCVNSTTVQLHLCLGHNRYTTTIFLPKFQSWDATSAEPATFNGISLNYDNKPTMCGSRPGVNRFDVNMTQHKWEGVSLVGQNDFQK